MASDAYELLALLMRYVFVLLGALVLFRAYRWMRKDARNYRREMRSLPDAGLVGEIVDLRTGQSQPLPREGDMGASRECDVFVKAPGVARHHLRFAFEEGKGVLLTPTRHGKTLMSGRALTAPAYALHGTQIQLGQASLRLRLFAGLKVPSPMAFQQEAPAPDPMLSGGADEEEEDSFLSPGLPGVFDLPSFPPQEDAGAEEPATDQPWQQPQPYDPYVPAGQGAPLPPHQGYEGGYTDEGQMTWQYAYSLEELQKAQAAQTPGGGQDDDGAEGLPYQSPVSRRRRRDRR